MSDAYREIRCPASHHKLCDVRGQGTEFITVCRCKRRVRIAPDLTVTVLGETTDN